jgi:Na+/H+-dicarboxylate symporter
MFRRLLRLYSRVPLGTRLVVAFLTGALTGPLVGERALVLAPVSRVLVDGLRLVAPLVVAAFVVSGLSGARLRQLSSTGGRALVAFVAMSVGAAAAGALVAWPFWAGQDAFGAVGGSGHAARTWADALSAWRPSGWTFPAETMILGSLVIAIPSALALGAWHEARPEGTAARIREAAHAAARLIGRAVSALMSYAPVGTFALAAIAFGQRGGAVGTGLLAALVTVAAAQVLVGAVVAATLLIGRHSPVALFKSSQEALVTALATGSSAATMAVELEVMERAVHVPSLYARIVAPLGVTFSKVGTTAFLGALTVCAGAMAGIPLTAGWLLKAVVVCSAAGLATPPVSGGGFVMLSVVFGQMGLPLALVPMLGSIPFVGKLNTPLNSFGRIACAAALVSAASRRTEPARLFDAPSAPTPVNPS